MVDDGSCLFGDCSRGNGEDDKTMSEEKISNEKAIAWFVAIVAAGVNRYFAIFVAACLALDSFGVERGWLTFGRAAVALTFVQFFAPHRPEKGIREEVLHGSAIGWSMRKIFEAWFLVGFVYGFKLIFA